MVTKTRARTAGFFGGEPRSRSSDTAVSVLRFIGPRYWRSWILIGWLRLAAALPWRFSLTLHQRFGRWLGSKSRKSTKLVDENLQVCFPDLTDAERNRLTSDYFANMGAMVAELGLAWFGSLSRIREMFAIEGAEHLEHALARGHGVLLCAGHFTPMELCAVGVRPCTPRYTLLYNKRRSQLLSEFQRRSRERYADESFQKHDIRGLLRSLRKNSVVWFSADEAHTGKSSAMIPFFGAPALTNTALSRLARISGAAVMPMFYCRRADDSGYLIRFEPALEGFPSDDAIADTKRLVRLLEQQIEESPAQYFWKQRRFRSKNTADPQDG